MTEITLTLTGQKMGSGEDDIEEYLKITSFQDDVLLTPEFIKELTTSIYKALVEPLRNQSRLMSAVNQATDNK
jgi:hypothetical protein